MIFSLHGSHRNREGSLFPDCQLEDDKPPVIYQDPYLIYPIHINWKLGLAAAPSCGTVVATSAINRKTEQSIKHSCGNVVSVFSGFI